MIKIVRLQEIENIGIFKTYYNDYESNFISLFGDIGSEGANELDLLLSDVYGTRALLSRYAAGYADDSVGTIKRIVSHLNYKYFNDWIAVKKAVDKTLLMDVISPIKERKEKTSERDNSNSYSNQNTRNAYDVDEISSDTTGNESNSETSENASEVTEWYRANNRIATGTAKELIDFVAMNDYIDIVLHDIVIDVTIHIDV